MKSLVFLLCNSLFTLAMIHPVYADITKQFPHDEYMLGPPFTHYFSFNVRITVQTEPDGTWIIGSRYRIIFLVSFSYINQTWLTAKVEPFSSKHALLIQIDPKPVLMGHENYSGSNACWSDLTLAMPASAHLDATASPSNLQDGWFSFEPYFTYNVSVNAEVFSLNYWRSFEEISIRASDQTSEGIHPFIYVALGMLIAAIPSGTYFLIKRRTQQSITL